MPAGFNKRGFRCVAIGYVDMADTEIPEGVARTYIQHTQPGKRAQENGPELWIFEREDLKSASNALEIYVPHWV
jgi:hypothetical protein